MDYQASSLYSVIADGVFRETSLNRTSWMSLIETSILQHFCNRQGFSQKCFAGGNLRLGLIANQEDDCSTPDSFIGFGFNPVLERCVEENLRHRVEMSWVATTWRSQLSVLS